MKKLLASCSVIAIVLLSALLNIHEVRADPGDDTTEAPTLIAPESNQTYSTTVPFTVSFILPENPLSGSLTLTFVPTSGPAIVLGLRDAAPISFNTFSFDLTGDFLSVEEILSATGGSSIEPGNYTIAFSYQDELANTAAVESVSNVTITDEPPAEGTLRFHIFTDDDGDGTQDSGDEDGFDEDDDLVILIGDVEVSVDDEGNIDSALEVGDYTLTIIPPAGYAVKGGSSTIEFSITADEVTNIGSRGIYHRSGSSSSSSSGGSSSSRRSSSRSSSSNSNSSSNSSSSVVTRSDDSSSQSTPLNSTPHTSAFDALPTPVAKEPACLKTGSRLAFSDSNNNATADYLSSLVFTNDNNKHLIQGYSNGTFRPQNALTRFEALAIAMRSNCIGGGNSQKFTHPNTQFSDVPKDNSEQSLIIGEAFHRGIITGIGDKFFPDKTVTYGEMIKMLFTPSSYFQQGQPVTSLTITLQAANNSVFAQYLEHAHRMDILPASFDVSGNVNRAGMAMILKNYISAQSSMLIL